MEAGNDFPSNVVDTTHDYMELIYQFVIETNKPKKDIFQIIQEDFEEFVNSPEFIKPKNDENDNDVNDERVSWYIQDWTYKYAKNITIDQKNEMYNTYGVNRLLWKLNNIASVNGFNDFDDFLTNYDLFHVDVSDPEVFIIKYMIENKALFDIIKGICPYYDTGSM